MGEMHLRMVLVFVYAGVMADFSALMNKKVREGKKTDTSCDQAVYTGNVLETARPGTFILRVAAQASSGVVWSIPDKSLREFAVDADTGDIFLFARLTMLHQPKKARRILDFHVLAREKSNRQKVCESLVRINVVPASILSVDADSMDGRQIVIGTPVYGQQSLVQFTGLTSSITLTQPSYQFTVTACVPGAFVGQIVLQSSFTGPVSFSILSGNVFYGINSQTGAITLQNIPPPGLQTLLVTAQTAGGLSATVPVTITSPCSASGPTGVISAYANAFFGDTVAFTQSSYQFSSSACTAGSVLGQVSAQASGQSVTYSIPAGNTFFAVNPTTGLLSTTLAPPGGTWSQTFVVAATSGTGRTTSVTVTVTNTCSNPGGFIQPSYTFSLNNCAVGNIVGNVFASAGVTGGVAYSIPSGNPFFAISPATGQITILQAPPIGTQSFTTQSISSSGQTSTAIVTINVSAGPPTFPGTYYSFTLTNCIAGATIGQVSATSCGSGVSYSLLGDGNLFYTINQLTGQLSLLAVPPPGSQTFAVEATSSNGQSVVVPVVVSSPCGQYNVVMPYSMPAYYYPQQDNNRMYYRNRVGSGAGSSRFSSHSYGKAFIPYLK